MRPVEGVEVLTLALNLPGPLAAARLCRLGASVVKVEPPSGDALAPASPRWYEQLPHGQTVLTLDLKGDEGFLINRLYPAGPDGRC
jgi:crotonobetainyl-CoA:carnitine CoA-transferase CaiB-like acyl-CoA transferase